MKSGPILKKILHTFFLHVSQKWTFLSNFSTNLGVQHVIC